MRVFRLWLARRRLVKSRWHRAEASRLLDLVERTVNDLGIGA